MEETVFKGTREGVGEPLISGYLYPGKVVHEVLPTPQAATSEPTGQWGTHGLGDGKYAPRVKSLREKFLIWAISKILPGFHLAINPPKGIKRSRKTKEVAS